MKSDLDRLSSRTHILFITFLTELYSAIANNTETTSFEIKNRNF